MSSYEDIRKWREATAESRQDLLETMKKIRPKERIEVKYSDMDVFTVAFANELEELERDAFNLSKNQDTGYTGRGVSRAATTSEATLDVFHSAVDSTLRWRNEEERLIFRTHWEPEVTREIAPAD